MQPYVSAVDRHLVSDHLPHSGGIQRVATDVVTTVRHELKDALEDRRQATVKEDAQVRYKHVNKILIYFSLLAAPLLVRKLKSDVDRSRRIHREL